MENKTRQLDKQETTVREYLLERLDDADTERIDERIMTEPGFFDTVLSIEQELLEDLVAGRLSGEEKARVEHIYTRPANREKLDAAAALYKAVKEQDAVEMALPYPQAAAPAASARPKNVFWRFSPLVLVPAAAAIAVILLFLYVFPGKRSLMEKELALLNSGQVREAPVRGVTLQPDSARNVALMPKIRFSGNNEIVRLELGIIGEVSESYDAAFLDDQGKEMFVVSNIGTQKKAEGTFVDVLVPADFLREGDYQINLQGRSAGGPVKAGSFTFRVTQ